MNLLFSLTLLAVVAIIGARVLFIALEAATATLQQVAYAHPVPTLIAVFVVIVASWTMMVRDAVGKP